MNSPSAEDVIEAFAQVVREQLEQGNSIEVPELGTFEVEHRPSQMKEDESGESYMAPPRDEITFQPER